jgi:ATP-dependent protease ClpP protease subunit
MKDVRNFIDRSGETPEIILYSDIEQDVIGGQLFAEALSRLSDADQVNIRINSAGGSLMEGLSMYAAIGRFPKQIHSYVDGVAASAAALIALASNRVYIAKHGKFMFHNAHTKTGNPDADKMIDEFNDTISKMIKDRTGWDDEKIRSILDQETYYGADEAIEAGLADEKFSIAKVAIAENELPSDVRKMQQVFNMALQTGRSVEPADARNNGGGTNPNPMPGINETIKGIANALNLNPNLEESAVLDEVKNLKNKKEELEKTVKDQKAKLDDKENKIMDLEGKQIEKEVDDAIEVGKFSKEKREEILNQAKKDPDYFRSLANTIPAQKNRSPTQEVRDGTHQHDSAAQTEVKNWLGGKKLDDMEREDPALVERMMNEAPEAWSVAFKQAYGVDPKGENATAGDD